MIAREHLSYDAFGTYTADGPIDKIIQRFEAARVMYRNVHNGGGHFYVVFLRTPRSQRIVKEEADRYLGTRAWAFRQAQLALLEEHYPEESFQHLRDTLVESFPLFETFDLALKDCEQCGEAHPEILSDRELCPECQKE